MYRALKWLIIVFFGTTDLSGDYIDEDAMDKFETEVLTKAPPHVQAFVRDAFMLIMGPLDEAAFKYVHGINLSCDPGLNKFRIPFCRIVLAPISYSAVDASRELKELIGSVIVEYQTELGPEREKLYPHIQLYPDDARSLLLPPGTGRGRGRKIFPPALKEMSLRVVGANDSQLDFTDLEPGEIPDPRPPVRILDRKVPQGQYVLLFPKAVTYSDYLAVAQRYVPEESMIILFYYLTKAFSTMAQKGFDFHRLDERKLKKGPELERRYQQDVYAY